MANSVFYKVLLCKMLWKSDEIVNAQEQTGALEIE